MQGFTTIDLIILVVYLAVVLFAGLHFSREEMKGKELFRGDGTIPWWVTSISISTTLLSSISFLPLARNSYARTWIMRFAQLGMVMAILITIKFFLPTCSKLDIDTAYHYLKIRFGSKDLRVLGAAMLIIYQAGRMSITMYLPSVVPVNLTGINADILTIAMGVIAIIHSYTGGLKSVLWTDFIRGSVFLVGVTFTLFYLADGVNGGFGAILQSTTRGKFPTSDQPIFNPDILKDSVLLLIVEAGLNTCLFYVSSQDIVQRFTTTIDVKKLNRIMLTNGVPSIFIATVFYLIDTGLYVFYSQDVFPPIAQWDQIFASYITYQLPVGIIGLLLAAIYIASQSTLSTGLNSVTTSQTLDIQERLSRRKMSFALRTKTAQYVSLGVGTVTILVFTVLANGETKPAYRWFNGFMGLVPGVLSSTFALGTFTKVANAKDAYVTFSMTTVTMVYIKYMVPVGSVSIWSYSIVPTAISLVAGILIDVITGKLDGDISRLAEDATIYHN